LSILFHFLARIIRFACAALLAAGLIAVPRHLSAQEPAPQTGTEKAADQSQTPELNVPPGHIKAEEEEEHNVYRHTALVGSISDAIFHDDKNATEPEKVELREKHIEKTARAFEIINAAIIWLCILIPLAKFLPKLMRKRSSTLSHNLETARKTTADANARLSSVEAQLSRLDEEIARIRAQVEEESRQDETRIKASIEEEKARIVAAAEQEIGAAAAQARRSLRYFAADIAIENATKQLVLTPETDRKLIAEFIGEAQSESGNGNDAHKGGRN